jgi:RNA-directed DNA polymerase
MIFFNKMMEDLGKEKQEIIDFAITAYKRYRRYEIKKKTGGYRSIHHPTPELKEYQRFISKHIFQKLPIHKSVFSYKKKTSIKNLADIHKKDRYLLRIDLKDFFPSIRGENIRLFLEEKKTIFPFTLTDLDLTLINLLVCKKSKLTIGAPSSPSISNAILYNFDDDIYTMCKDRKIKYSRYADDLYFSTNEENELSNILNYIKEYSFPYKLRLRINYKENIFSSKKYKRVITGLTITTEGNVSVGRKQKRYIKSLINSYRYKSISIDNLSYLKGYLSFLLSIEPLYINLLKNKYSEEIINELLLNKYSRPL